MHELQAFLLRLPCVTLECDAQAKHATRADVAAYVKKLAEEIGLPVSVDDLSTDQALQAKAQAIRMVVGC